MKQQIKTWAIILAAVSLVAVSLFQTAAAGLFDEGQAAYRRGDYAAAIVQWRPLAERGNGDAQQALGLLSDLGYGVTQSFDEAVRWYRLSAEGGNGKGQFRLAFMYSHGLGLPKDEAQATRWYRKAAGNGIAAADFKQQHAPRDDYWAGTETLPPQVTDQQLNEIVQRMEAAAGERYPDYGRYYAAVSMRKPDPANISANFDQYYGLMTQTGAARVSVRAIYLRAGLAPRQRGEGPGVHIVMESALPMISDGGCSVVTVWYDGARQTTLPPRCNGLA